MADAKRCERCQRFATEREASAWYHIERVDGLDLRDGSGRLIVDQLLGDFCTVECVVSAAAESVQRRQEIRARQAAV